MFSLLENENNLLKSLVGNSYNNKSRLEAGKILDEIHSKAQQRMISKRALCFILDKNEIKAVGGSTLLKDKKTGEIVSNLILDQFGLWLTGLFTPLSAGNRTITITDSTGAPISVAVYTSLTTFNAIVGGVAVGQRLQVGSGSSSPLRTNFAIETPFATVPEMNPFSGSTPVWNSGSGLFKTAGLISAGGSGTVRESILRNQWRDVGVGTRNYTMFRDLISPALGFTAGQSIALEYTVQL